MKQDFIKRLTSRKFILALVGAGVVFLNGAFDLGLNQADILSFVGIILGYIGAEGVADIKGR